MIRKVETFNASKFLVLAREAREEAAALVGSNPFIQTHRDALRFVLDEADYTNVSYVETARTAEEVRNELVVAAIRAGERGASRAQIDVIVHLCEKIGDFAEMGYSTLTVAQASSLINDLKCEA